MPKNDALGKAVHDYFFKKETAPLIVHSDHFDDDEMPLPYLFRKYKEMPKIEQVALDLCTGRVLDVGACTGMHSLHLQNKGLDVTALEQSKLCAEVISAQGVRHVAHQNFYAPVHQTYDTVLLLMNGVGIAKNLFNFPIFLKQLKSLLTKGGQVLLDSSDLIYLYENEEGNFNIPLNSAYYGELNYAFEYKGCKDDYFPWLFLSIDRLEELTSKEGFKMEVILEGDHYDYLARLSVNNF